MKTFDDPIKYMTVPDSLIRPMTAFDNPLPHMDSRFDQWTETKQSVGLSIKKTTLVLHIKEKLVKTSTPAYSVAIGPGDLHKLSYRPLIRSRSKARAFQHEDFGFE